MLQHIKPILIILTIVLTAFIVYKTLIEINKPFNTKEWSNNYDPVGPPRCRRQMLNDLTQHHTLVGLKRPQLIELLGPPDGSDSVSFSYQIMLKYEGVDPVGGEDLNVYFNKDSITTMFKVVDWGKTKNYVY